MSNLANTPADWKILKCNDIFEFNNGKAFYSDGYSNFGYRVVDLLNIDLSGKFRTTNKDKFISESVYRKSARAHLFKDDLIIIMTDITPTLGLIGKTAVIDASGQYVLNQRVGCLRLKRSENSIEFMNYLFNSSIVRKQVVAATLGSVQFYVNTPVLKGLLLPFPPIRQQQKIAHILTTIDKLIESTQALIDKYTSIKQGMMADLFTRGIDLSGTPDTNPNHGQLRPPHEESPELYKQTELGWVPKEWKVYTFEELAEYKNGGSFSADDWKEEGFPIIRIQNLNGSNEYNYYQGEVKENWHVLAGDLLFAWSGQKGVSFGARLWSGSEGVLNQHIFKIYENKKLLSRQFLYYLFKINVSRIEDNAHGFKDSFVHVTRSELTDVAIMLPLTIEQERIEARVLSIDSTLEIAQKNLSKHKKLKKGLMQDLLIGKVSVD